MKIRRGLEIYIELLIMLLISTYNVLEMYAKIRRTIL